MGGGGSSSVTPTTPAGYIGGPVSAYNPPAFSASPIINTGGGWSSGAFVQGLGKGLSSFGSAVSDGSPTPPLGETPQLGSPSIYGSEPMAPIGSNYIPQNNLLDALMRILGGQTGG